MPAIPENFLLGGYGFNPAHAGAAGASDVDLVGALNGLAYDVNRLKGTAPSTITSPAGTTVPTVTSPAGTTVPTIDAALNSALSAYGDPAAPTGPENTADRNTINALRAEVVQVRNYLEALRLEVVQLRSYAEALRTEVVALRAAATTRAGYTLRTTVSSDYT
jgi:hypothetical protein